MVYGLGRSRGAVYEVGQAAFERRADWLLGWNDAGTELFYLDLEGNLCSVKVDLGDRVVADLPTILFSTRAGITWDNKSGGDGFVFGVPNDSGDDFPITLIVNWAAESGL